MERKRNFKNCTAYGCDKAYFSNRKAPHLCPRYDVAIPAETPRKLGVVSESTSEDFTLVSSDFDALGICKNLDVEFL